MLHNFCRTFPCEPFAHESELFPFKLLHKQPHVFRWKDLTLAVQIPHPTQARFKFPYSSGTDDSQMPVGCPGGRCWSFELIGALWRIKCALVFIFTEIKICFPTRLLFFQLSIFLPFYSQKADCFSMTFHDLLSGPGNPMTFQVFYDPYEPWRIVYVKILKCFSQAKLFIFTFKHTTELSKVIFFWAMLERTVLSLEVF